MTDGRDIHIKLVRCFVIYYGHLYWTVGKTWGITPRIAHWIYIAGIRPMITHAAVAWWPRVELEIARVLLERLQCLACLAITGAMNTTPTAAMEILIGLVRYH